MNRTSRFPFWAGDVDLSVVDSLVDAVPLDPKFRLDLKTRLLAAHPELVARRTLWHSLTADPLRIWSVIATLPVLVGIVALLWKRSQRTVEQPA